MVMGQRVLGHLVVRPVSVAPRDSGKQICWAVDVVAQTDGRSRDDGQKVVWWGS